MPALFIYLQGDNMTSDKDPEKKNLLDDIEIPAWLTGPVSSKDIVQDIADVMNKSNEDNNIDDIDDDDSDEDFDIAIGGKDKTYNYTYIFIMMLIISICLIGIFAILGIATMGNQETSKRGLHSNAPVYDSASYVFPLNTTDWKFSYDKYNEIHFICEINGDWHDCYPILDENK